MIQVEFKDAENPEMTRTGHVAGFVVVRQMPSNQRPDLTYDEVQAVVCCDDGTFKEMYLSEIKRRRGV